MTAAGEDHSLYNPYWLLHHGSEGPTNAIYLAATGLVGFIS